MSLLIEYPPSAEPVSTDEVKALLRLGSAADDFMIAQLITSAREFAEKVTRRSLVYKGYKATYDKFPSPGLPIRLPAPPLIEVASVLYLDSALDQQEWDSAEYFVAGKQSPGLIVAKPSNVYPVAASVPDSVEIHFYAGYSSDGYGDASRPLPEHIRLAIMQLAAHWYDHPEMVSAEAQNEVPRGLMELLNANKIYVF